MRRKEISSNPEIPDKETEVKEGQWLRSRLHSAEPGMKTPGSQLPASHSAFSTAPLPHLLHHCLSSARDFLELAVLDFVSFLSLLVRAGCKSGRLWAACSMRLIDVLSNK